jgi:hypothetical protein
MGVAISIPLVTFNRRLAFWIQILRARQRRHLLETWSKETMLVLSQIHCIRDSLFLSNRDPDLNLPFQILHQTYRNVSYALHLFGECLVPKLSPLMSKIAAILNDNTENLALPPPPPPSLDDDCVAQICPLSLPPLRMLQLNQVPLAELDAQRNSTQKLPALQVAEPSLRLPPHSSTFGVTSVAESQPSLTPSLHATPNAMMSIYSRTTTAGAGSFDAHDDPASACPSLQENFSTTSPSLISGQEPTSLLPSATLSEQTDSIRQQHPPYTVEAKSFWASKGGHSHLNLASEIPRPVIDYEAASNNQNEKRKRNVAASRRYRERKKDRIQDLEALVKGLERERDFYYGEWCFYYDFIVHRIGSHLLPPRPRPPTQQFRH